MSKEDETAKEPGSGGCCSCDRGGCWYKLCWSCRLSEIWEAVEDGDDAAKETCACGEAEPYPISKTASWKKGRCTDLFCLIVFVVFWIGMAAVCAIGFSLGNTSRILYANDYNGQNCHTGGTGLGKCTRPGRSCPEDLYGKKVIVYPRLKDDLLFALSSGFDTASPQDGVNLLKLRLYGVCVAECPKQGSHICDYEGDALLATRGGNTTALEHVQKCYSTLWAIPSFAAQFLPTIGPLGDCAQIMSHCWLTPIDTVNVFNRCLPSIEAVEAIHDDCVLPAVSSDDGGASSHGCITIKRTVDVESERPAGDQVIYDKLAGAASTMMKWCADLSNTSFVVFIIGVLVAFALAWAWVICVQFCVSPIVWTTLVFAITALGLGSLLLYNRAGALDFFTPAYLVRIGSASVDYTGATSNRASASGAASSIENAIESTTGIMNISSSLALTPKWSVNAKKSSAYYLYAAYAASILWVVLIVASLALCKQIRVSIQIMKEAAKALQAMPTLVFFPLWSMLGIGILSIYFLYVLAYLMSAGKITTGDIAGLAGVDPMSINITSTTIPKQFENESTVKVLALYHLFGFLWTANAIQALGMATIACSMAAWYFEPEVNISEMTYAEEKEYMTQLKQEKFWCFHCCMKKTSETDAAAAALAESADDAPIPASSEKRTSMANDDDLRLWFEKPGLCECSPLCPVLNCAPDRDGDGEISCAEKLDCDPNFGCVLYTLTLGCCCNCFNACCMSGPHREKLKRMGAVNYTVVVVFREMCPLNNRAHLEKCICFRGYIRAITFQVGSLLVGAFAIALVQWLRVVAHMVESQVKKVKKAKNSKLVEKMMKVVHLMLAAIESCVKFISRNTYIMIAMRNLGFLRASAHAIGLLTTNVHYLIPLKTISFVITLFGKLIIISICGALTAVWTRTDPMFAIGGDRALHSTLLTTLLTMVVAAMVAQVFFYTFSMTVDTILLCFCYDIHVDGEADHNLALRKVIGGSTSASNVKVSIEWGNGKMAMMVNSEEWSTLKLKALIIASHRGDLPTRVDDFDLYDAKGKLLEGELKGKLRKRFRLPTRVELRVKGGGGGGSVAIVRGNPVVQATPMLPDPPSPGLPEQSETVNPGYPSVPGM